MGVGPGDKHLILIRTFLLPFLNRKTFTLFFITLMVCLYQSLFSAAGAYGEQEGISGDIFGMRDRWFQPFIRLEETYSDNLFNRKHNREDDFITTISPGFSLSLSGSQDPFSGISSSTTSPGGLQLDPIYQLPRGRYQAGFIYTPVLERYADHTDQNTFNQAIDGRLAYNFSGGLSVTLSDQFISNYDERATGISIEQDKYKTNLILASISYDVSSKLSLKTGYSNFKVNYKSRKNSPRDRTDNGLSGAFFFRILPKTALFAEYESVCVNYREQTNNDSRQQIFWGGMQWIKSQKSRGMVKAGYGVKDFEGTRADDSKTIHLQLQLDHDVTPKTSIRLSGYREEEEPVIATADYTLSHSIKAGYTQKLTERLSFHTSLEYKNDRFKQDQPQSSETSIREDDYYYFIPSFNYNFRPWLKAGIEYTLSRRDSDLSAFDYTTNTTTLKISASL